MTVINPTKEAKPFKIMNPIDDILHGIGEPPALFAKRYILLHHFTFQTPKGLAPSTGLCDP